MEIEVKPEPMLNRYDSGGGYHEVKVTIYYDPLVDKRLQKHTLIFEALLSQLRYMGHDKVEILADVVLDTLDQWESNSGS